MYVCINPLNRLLYSRVAWVVEVTDAGSGSENTSSRIARLMIGPPWQIEE